MVPTSADDCSLPGKREWRNDVAYRELPEWLLKRIGKKVLKADRLSAKSPEKALELFKAALAEAKEAAGPDDEYMLWILRGHVITQTGRCGRAEEALQMARALHRDILWSVGPTSENTLRASETVAFWAAESGRLEKAAKLWRSLAEDWDRHKGPSWPETLGARLEAAMAVGACGRPAEAAEEIAALLPGLQQLAERNPYHGYLVERAAEQFEIFTQQAWEDLE